MMDEITFAAAHAIAKVAFDKFVEGGAGELGKKTTESITKLIQKLGETVWPKAIKGKPQAEQVLIGAAQDSPKDVQKLKNYILIKAPGRALTYYPLPKAINRVHNSFRLAIT